MYLIALHLVALLWIPLMVCEESKPMQHTECRNLLNLEKFSFCCGVSLVDKFLFVGSNCTNYWNNFGACRYECLYNHWKLFDSNNTIKKPELYTMITNLYNPLNGYHRYGSAFKEASEDCEQLEFNYTEFALYHADGMRTQLGLDTKCRPNAMFHMMCIMAHVTHNCPKEFLKTVQECEYLRDLIPNCVPDLIHQNVYLVAQYSEDQNRNIEDTTGGTSNRMMFLSTLLLAVLGIILICLIDFI